MSRPARTITPTLQASAPSGFGVAPLLLPPRTEEGMLLFLVILLVIAVVFLLIRVVRGQPV